MGSKSDMVSSMEVEMIHPALTVTYNSMEEDFIDMMDPPEEAIIGQDEEEEEEGGDDEVGFISKDGTDNLDFEEPSGDTTRPSYTEAECADTKAEVGRMEAAVSLVIPRVKKGSSRKQGLNKGSKSKSKSSKSRKEPWSCQFCNRKFTQRSSKHRHEKLHLGVKPHKCHFCDKAFTRKYILDEHERVHTGEKPYKCTVCSKSYTLRTCLRKHEFHHFGGQAHECVNCSGELIDLTATPSSRPERQDMTTPSVEEDEEPLDLATSSLVSEKSQVSKKESVIPTAKKVSTLSGFKGGKQLVSQRPSKPSSGRRHKCYQCGKTFGSSRVLQMHKRVHEADGRFRCRYCGKAFSMRTILIEHESKHTLMEESSDSPKPSKESSLLHSFLLEAKDAQKKKKEVVHSIQPLSSKPKVHEKEQLENLRPEKPYMCLYCMKAFRHTCSLVKHAKKYRGSCFDPTIARPVATDRRSRLSNPGEVASPKSEICSSPRKKTSKKTKKDPLDSPTLKLFRCNVCLMTFTQRTSWQIHKRTHTKGNQHLCGVCDMAFVAKAQFLEHQKKYHSGCEPPLADQFETGDAADEPNNVFEEDASALSHANSPEAMPDDTPTDERNAGGEQEVHACVYCSRTFNSFHLLRSHQESMHDLKMFVCPRCNLSFCDRMDLQAHMSVHAEEKLFRCSICKRSFVQEENYKKHLQHHQKDKRHKCQYCEKTFERNSYRLQHERTHTGERPFACRFCSKTFAQRNSMQRHEIIHLGIKKYKCDICEKAFGRRESLQNHILTHTKDIKVKLVK